MKRYFYGLSMIVNNLTLYLCGYNFGIKKRRINMKTNREQLLARNNEKTSTHAVVSDVTSIDVNAMHPISPISDEIKHKEESGENKKTTVFCTGEKKLTATEKEKLSQRVKGLSSEELYFITSLIPFDICMERISNEFHRNEKIVNGVKNFISERE